MEESHGKVGAMRAVGSSGEILYLMHQRWPFPHVPSGDGEVLSFAVTQEPWAGVAVTNGSVARFAERLPCSDVTAKFFPGKLDGMCFPLRFQMHRLFLATHHHRLPASQS